MAWPLFFDSPTSTASDATMESIWKVQSRVPCVICGTCRKGAQAANMLTQVGLTSVDPESFGVMPSSHPCHPGAARPYGLAFRGWYFLSSTSASIYKDPREGHAHPLSLECLYWKSCYGMPGTIKWPVTCLKRRQTMATCEIQNTSHTALHQYASMMLIDTVRKHKILHFPKSRNCNVTWT